MISFLRRGSLSQLQNTNRPTSKISIVLLRAMKNGTAGHMSAERTA